MITVNYNDDQFRAKTQALNERIGNPTGLAKVVGQQLKTSLRRHFLTKDRNEPSALGTAGGRRTHFWNQIRDSVSNATVLNGGSAVTVSISDARFAQKYYGGRITAKAAGALTIPLVPEAYAMRASTYEAETGLKLFILRKPEENKAFLAAEQDGQVRVIYLLTKSVDQDKDPTALPDMDVLRGQLIRRAESWVTRQEANAATIEPLS
jgi:hypothetical protein